MIVLNMIVKNEEETIKECLESTKPFFDKYCIVDTGSTDKTKDIIKDVLKDKDGVIIDRPWVNFGHNRTEAFNLAREYGDWVLCIDADQRLVGEIPTALDKSIDGYSLMIKNGNVIYRYIKLFNSEKDWIYSGPTHEYPTFIDEQPKTGDIDSLLVNDLSWQYVRPDKFTMDIELLSNALEKEPENSRYLFYLGNSYRDAEMDIEAINAYNKRLTIGGWLPETADAYLQVARLLWKQNNGNAARMYCINAIGCNPNFKEALLFMAEMSYEDEAKAWKRYAEIATNDKVLFVRV